MEFSKNLKRAMQQLGLRQSQIVGMTGCSKSAVSQYLSGKNTPPANKQRDIAVSLGLDPDFFIQETDQDMKVFPHKINDGSIPQLSVSDAARLLGMNHTTVRKGLQQGVFPWGYAIHTSENRWVYFINAKRFEEIERMNI